MALSILAGLEAIGFEQRQGWVLRKCAECGEKTYERVRHKFPSFSDDPKVGYWIKRPMHFQCHVTRCLHTFCQKFAPEFEEIKLQRLHTYFGGVANTPTGKGEVL